MTERERFAWVWLAVLAIGYGGYFAVLALGASSVGEVWPRTEILLLCGATGFQMLVLGVSAVAARVRRGGPAPKPDERDRAIERRAAAVGYYVLLAGVIVAGILLPLDPASRLGEGGWRIAHAAILAIVVAEVVHHGLVALAYRRGWHG